MKILLFNTAHRWIGEAAGTQLLARTLAERGHDVVMAVPRSGELYKSLSQEKQSYTLQPIDWRLSKGGGASSAQQYRAVANLLRSLRPDIIHVGRGKEHWCAAFVRPAVSRNSRIVRTRHVVLPMKHHWPNRWLFRRGTDAVTAVSIAAFNGLGELGAHLSSDRRRVIYGAIDLNRYSSRHRQVEVRKELGAFDENTVLVGLLGRWQRIKGHDVFLEALSKVLKTQGNVRAVVAGRKVSLDHPRLRKMHDDFGLEGRIIYLGSVDKPEELIGSLDIGVIASRGSEGFSRIAAEYMASEVPIVATTVGALPEMITDEEDGLLVPPNNPDEMATAIGRLVEDESMRKRFSVNGVKTVTSRFSPERLAEEMEEVYKSITL